MKSIVSMVNYDKATPAQKAAHDREVSLRGGITNMKKTLLHNVASFDVLMEWYKMREEALKFLPERSALIFCHAISTENDCLICSTFFRRLLKNRGENPDELKLNAEEQLLADFGRAIVKDPRNIDNSIYEKLQKSYNEEQLVILTAFAGMMIATNLINHVLRVPLDSYLEAFKKGV